MRAVGRPLPCRAAVLQAWAAAGQGPLVPPWPSPWPLLLRRLPSRVPSLRVLRSFFTDGVSGAGQGGWSPTPAGVGVGGMGF